MERGRGRGPGPGPSRGLDRVASVLGVGRSVGLGIGPGRAEGVAVQGQSNIGEGPAPPQLSKPGSGRKAACVESGLASAYALEGARGGKGVAGQGPSDTGGAAAPPRWAKPGSGGREPSPGPLAQRRPPPALGSAARLLWRRQGRVERLRGGHSPFPQARYRPGIHLLGVGQAPACALHARQAARASSGKGRGQCRATQGRAQPLPTGRSSGPSETSSWAGSPLGWGQAQIQPARPKERQTAKASPG